MLRIIATILLLQSYVLMFGHGEVHERIVLVSEEINAAPNNADLYIKRANLYLEDGDFNEVILDINKAKSLAGKNFPPTKMLNAQMYFKLQSNEVALKHINEFLALEEMHVLGLLTKAKILVELDKREEAIECYKLAIENTSTLLPENFIDLINTMVDDLQYKEALQYCELAQLKFGQLLIFDLKSIEIAKLLEDYEFVLSKLDNIIDGQTRKERWYVKKAEVYIAKGESSYALENLNLAIESLKILPSRIKLTPAMQDLALQITDLKNRIEYKKQENINLTNN